MNPDSEASRRISSTADACSSDPVSVVGSAKVLVDCCGVLSEGSSRMSKQMVDSFTDSEMSSFDSAKVTKMESKFLEHGCGSSTCCGTENGEKLRSQSTVTSPLKDAEHGKEDSLKGGFLAVPHHDVIQISESMKDGHSCEKEASEDCKFVIGGLSGKQGLDSSSSEVVDSEGTRGYDGTPGLLSDLNHESMDMDDSQMTNIPNKEKVELSKVSCEHYDPVEVARVVAKEVEDEVATRRETSGSCSSIHQTNAAISNEDCSAENGCRNRFGNEHCKCSNSCSTIDNFEAETSMKNQGTESSQNIQRNKNELNDASVGGEPSLLHPKPKDVTVDNEPACASSIDLNEVISTNESDYQQSIINTVSCHSEIVPRPKPVVAKSDISMFLPELCLQLDGETNGWKGSGATSAFRPTKASSSVESSNEANSSQVTGFDLNIAADGSDCQKCDQAMPSFPLEESFKEANPAQSARFKIDLNSVDENEESSSASLTRLCVRDFNLNESPMSANASGHADQPGQPITLALGDRVSNNSNIARQVESNWARPFYHRDSNNRQSFEHEQVKTILGTSPIVLCPAKQVQNIVPWQQKATYAAVALPTRQPHGFPYHGAFFTDPNNQLSSVVYPPGIIPLMTSARVNLFHQVSGSIALPPFPSHPHFIQIPVGPMCSIDVMNARNIDQNGRLAVSGSGIHGEIGIQQFIPINNVTTEDQMACYQQLALAGPPMKRKEPEGGWDSNELGFRQVAPYANFS